MNLQEAIDAPAFHTGHFPSSFWPRGVAERVVEVEGRWGDGGRRRPARPRARRRSSAEPWSLGRLSAVSREPDGTLRAAANPRGMQGYAAGR